MNDLTTFSTFEEYKQILTAELTQASESFVRIGYLLKVARDTAILAGTEYKDVNEFAAAEYNLDKTQVSRFIRINDKFSEGGNSSRLQESFRGIGYAKLSMMLLLPDSLNEEITPAFSKTEVQALKEEVQAEQEVTPIERILEGEKPDLEGMSLLEKVVYEMFRTNPKTFEKAWEFCTGDPPHLDQPGGEELYAARLQEILAPAGEQIYSVRIQGTGRIAMSVKGVDRDIMLVNLRSDEKEPYGWFYLIQAVIRFTMPADSAGQAYEDLFSEPWPESEKAGVAPVQPKARKESKVTKAQPEKVKARDPENVTKPEEKEEEQKGLPTAAAPVPTEIEAPAAEDDKEAPAAGTEEPKEVDEEAPAAAAVNEEASEAAASDECEGQTDFGDFPEILPAPEIPEEIKEDVCMAVHNCAVEIRRLAENSEVSVESLTELAIIAWREEWTD